MSDRTIVEGTGHPVLTRRKPVCRLRERRDRAARPLRVAFYLRASPQRLGERSSQLSALETARRPQRPRLDICQVDEIFRADPDDVARVNEFARRYGLEVIDSTSDGRIIEVQGLPADLEQAFGVELALFERHGREGHGHRGEVSLPRQIADLVVTILGLHEAPATLARPMGSGSAAVGGLTPRELERLYRFPEDRGTSQHIAILEIGGGFYPQDLNDYLESVGLPARQPTVVGNNAPADKAMVKQLLRFLGRHQNPPSVLRAAGGTVETTMDLELAMALAPDADITVAFTAANSYAEILKTTREVISQVRPTVISASWSVGIEGMIQKGFIKAYEDVLDQARLAGITVCFASGDFGSSGTDTSCGSAAPEGYHADYPATSPQVLACGGTRLEAAGPDKQASEVWRQTYAPSSARGSAVIEASGGGFSRHFGDTPDWQSDARRAWEEVATDEERRLSRRKGRGTPDVAATAASSSGMRLLAAGESFRSLGTSAATPIWAALVARLNGSLSSEEKPERLGFVNDLLYDPGAAGAFHPTGTGSNSVRADSSVFTATPSAWDPACGLGEPDGRKLLAAIRKLDSP